MNFFHRFGADLIMNPLKGPSSGRGIRGLKAAPWPDHPLRLKDFFLRKGLFQLAALLGLVLAAGQARSQTVSPNSTTAFPILSVGLGARAIGMGESFTAVADDSSALYYNPAGLAQVGQPEIAIAHNLFLADGFYDNAGGAYPLGTAGSLGFGARYLNYGPIDRRDNFGNLLGSYTPYDMSAEAAFGFHVDKDLSLGFGTQWISQNIDGSVQAGMLWNTGFLFKPQERFSVGFDFKNLGVETGGNSLPAGVLWGAAFRLPLAPRDVHSLLLSGGGDLAFQGPGRLNAGFEYGFQKAYFLRGGYVLDLQDNQLDGLQGLDFGAGAHLGQLQFDYSFSFEGSFGNIQRFSLTFFFPPPAKPQPTAPLLPEPSWVPPPGSLESSLAASPNGLLPGVSSGPVSQPVMLRFQVTSEGDQTAQQLYDAAELKLKLGLKEEAVDLYLKAVDKDPNFEPAWNRLGRLFFDKSLESYRKALELDPKNARLRDWLDHFNPGNK